MKYIQAPLPFQGQKKNMLKAFEQFIKQQPPDTIFVDLFGGSGLLSHTAKTIHPKSKVIYNDFDNYTKRLKNINTTNAIIKDLRKITDGTSTKNKLSETKTKEVLKLIKKYESNGAFVDYITISSCICWALHYTHNMKELQTQHLYNRVVQKTYSADGYLNGVITTRTDYKTLFKKYNNDPNVLFFIDPPYLQTNESGYYKKNMWTLKDHLNILKCMINVRFCYFTSSKSDTIELVQWFNTINKESIKWKQYETRKMSGYIDYMFVNK